MEIPIASFLSCFGNESIALIEDFTSRTLLLTRCAMALFCISCTALPMLASIFAFLSLYALFARLNAFFVILYALRIPSSTPVTGLDPSRTSPSRSPTRVFAILLTAPVMTSAFGIGIPKSVGLGTMAAAFSCIRAKASPTSPPIVALFSMKSIIVAGYMCAIAS